MNFEAFEKEIYELKKLSRKIMSERDFQQIFNDVFRENDGINLDLILQKIKDRMVDMASSEGGIIQ